MKARITGVMLISLGFAFAAVEAKQGVWQSAVDPKPLSATVEKGLTWLVEHQHSRGGWSQGEESNQMVGRGANEADQPNVGDTAISVLALLRSGSTPTNGPYASAVTRGVTFLCDEIEASDEKSLYVTSVRGTRLQSKLGGYVDTFLAALVLPEVRGRLPDSEGNQRVEVSLAKVMDKIERNQQDDGSFGGGGWANALSQSIAAKGFNRAAQSGVVVSEAVRGRLEEQAASRYDDKSGTFAAGDAAGVDLYAGSASLSALQDSDNTNESKKDELQKKLNDGASGDEREQIEAELQRYENNKDKLNETKRAVVDRLDDSDFIAGFGSNGGEEFLSYMNIGESLVVDGGDEWTRWDKEMTANMERIQNEDGSWTGHHCITGRNFCTATALLALMTDRAPVPLSEGLSRR